MVGNRGGQRKRGATRAGAKMKTTMIPLLSLELAAAAASSA